MLDILGTNIYFGIFLAQIHTLLSSPDCPPLVRRSPSTISHVLPFASAVFGLYLMSFPSSFAQDAGWSRDLAAWAASIAPARADVPRFWTSLGAQILCLSIYLSPIMQDILSKRIPRYLGSVSFSMYLLHGPLMRSVLAMLVFGPAAMRGEMTEADDKVMRYPIPARWTLLFTVPLFGLILMACVHAWATKVEPIFGRVTKAMERFATGSGRDGPGSPLQVAIQNSKKSDEQK